jgi:hypothetical protein
MRYFGGGAAGVSVASRHPGAPRGYRWADAVPAESARSACLHKPVARCRSWSRRKSTSLGSVPGFFLLSRGRRITPERTPGRLWSSLSPGMRSQPHGPLSPRSHDYSPFESPGMTSRPVHSAHRPIVPPKKHEDRHCDIFLICQAFLDWKSIL